MNRFSLLVPALAALFIGSTFVQAQETIKDRKGFIPNRKHAVVAGKAIGILLTDGAPILQLEGRSGPADQLVFSTGGNSYRWVYVPTQVNPLITNLQVPVGDKGEKAVYAALNMANPKSVLPWAVTLPYALVEVEVNNGRGSPVNDSFVGTSFRVLDGSKEYPLKVVDVLKLVKASYADHIAKQQKNIDEAMRDAAERYLKGKAPTGPREKKDLMYMTWLPESNTMRVHFKTTISDGAYTIVNQGGGPLRDPPPLKLPPKKVSAESPVLRIAPKKQFAVKTGTTFGIEFGVAYIVNKDGKVVGTEELPIESFAQQLNVPVFEQGPRPLPRPLPVPPAKESI
ncbi:MAG: hypothetical protein HY289_04135 [Planctomycetes bacterium]|nr:hypothetical protein [Planctomycetota bacterium]